jgi:hypothetical protein
MEVWQRPAGAVNRKFVVFHDFTPFYFAGWMFHKGEVALQRMR